jgi:hypothetical protein
MTAFYARALAAALCLTLAAGCSSSGGSSGQKRPGRGDQGPVSGVTEEELTPEVQVAPPPYPRSDSYLAELKLRNPTSNRFFIDTASVSVEKDRVIRFVMVVRTPEDDTNIRFAGLRCDDRHWKDYAFQAKDHTWDVNENAQWRLIQELAYNNFQYTLYVDYFCLPGVLSSKPIGDARKIAQLLRHPPKRDPRIPFRNE